LGLFSRAAADEHEEMFDRRTLMHLAEQCGLRIERYARFLCGANQLALLASIRRVVNAEAGRGGLSSPSRRRSEAATEPIVYKLIREGVRPA
jgi:hypothetical protein